jgi:hypothetical protein
MWYGRNAPPSLGATLELDGKLFRRENVACWSLTQFVCGIVELFQRRKRAEWDACWSLSADIMDRAKIDVIEAVPGVHGVEGPCSTHSEVCSGARM